MGQVFVAPADGFMKCFDFNEAVGRVTIDLHRAHFWDISAVAAPDKVASVVGRNEATRTVIDKFGVLEKPEELNKLMAGP